MLGCKQSATRGSRRARWWRLIALLPALELLLSACGGGDHANSSISGPVRGTLLQNPPEHVATLSAARLLDKLGSTDSEPSVLFDLSIIATQELLTQSGVPVCDIEIYHIQYNTVGGANEDTTSSGALMVPSGLDARCRGPRPTVLYAHGTTTRHAFNIADLTDQQNAEGLFLAAFFASQGYVVVAPNYAGCDTSTLPYHPFLNADQQSKDMIDALSAARSALPTIDAPLTTDSGRLFITGYSQGGYVAMATHRAMEAAGMPVTAAAPLSGPYALAAFVDAVFSGEVDGGAPVFGAFLINAYHRTYPDIYSTTADIFEAQYATGIDSLLPTSLLRSQLYAQGKLPQYALFSSTPPDPSFANITPPTTPASLAPVFALGFGADNLITNSYRLRYLLDAQSNPDGGWPTSTTGVPASNPGLPLRKALKENDLRDWTPVAPVLLCGGDEDPIVFWLNTELMQGYWASHAPAAAAISVLDLESGGSDRYSSLKQGFALAKNIIAAKAVAQGATDGGAVAVAEAYHGALVGPFCFAAAKKFFESL